MAGEEPTARSVSFLTLILTLTEPGGVSVPATSREDVHALVDRDHDRRPHVPGTSLAGALREMVRGARGESTADAWFGRLLDEEDRAAAVAAGEVSSEASRIWVLGSRLREPAEPFTLASTAISRFRGAARDQTLRAEEALPAGTSFDIFLRCDDASDAEVEDLAGLLAAWRPLIGRGVSHGRGRCEAGSVRYGTLRLDSPDDLLTWLTRSGPDLARAVAVTPFSGVPAKAEPPVCRVGMSIEGPWRTGNGEKPKGEPIPMLRISGELVMPGSGIKGIVRSRAEYILRSVQVDVCDEQKCGSCWACRVFGYGGGADESSTAVGSRAMVRFANAPIHDAVQVERTHVAIDRFTGGARDTALYTMEAIESGSFTVLVEPLESMDPVLRREVQAVLRLVLEDLNDGIIGMGSGTARGYGSVSVDFGSSGLPGLDEARQVLAGMRDGAHVGG